MPPPIFPDQPQGISLDELAEAFAQVMGTPPRRDEKASPDAADSSGGPPSEVVLQPGSEATASADAMEAGTVVEEPATAEDSCPINPQTILEAMLFVGDRENRPLTPRLAAELMRDVAVEEIPSVVRELNRRYEVQGAPYHVVGDQDGYRLALRRELHPLSRRFHGRVREARLSQAAIDVLALVAYEQPITAERIRQLRGKSSHHVVAQLVRRGLLRIERTAAERCSPHYFTTERFLRLFHLESPSDLPRGENFTLP